MIRCSIATSVSNNNNNSKTLLIIITTATTGCRNNKDDIKLDGKAEPWNGLINMPTWPVVMEVVKV